MIAEIELQIKKTGLVSDVIALRSALTPDIKHMTMHIGIYFNGLQNEQRTATMNFANPHQIIERARR